MKKNFFKALFALMCGCLMTTGFVACGSDDDDSTSNPGQEQQGGNDEEEDWGKAQNGVIEYFAKPTNLSGLQQMSANGKVMVKYLDSDGQIKEQELTGDFSKTVSLTPDQNKELHAAMMVYIEDIDSTKVSEVIGTVPMNVAVSAKAIVNFENKKNVSYNVSASSYFSFNEFDRENLSTKMSSLWREIQRNITKFGVCQLGLFDYRVGEYIYSSDKFWRTDKDE